MWRPHLGQTVPEFAAGPLVLVWLAVLRCWGLFLLLLPKKLSSCFASEPRQCAHLRATCAGILETLEEPSRERARRLWWVVNFVRSLKARHYCICSK